MSKKVIRQTVQFSAGPHEVYKALMNSEKHAQFTGAKAKISPKVGGKLTAYDDYIEGINIELVPDEKIVQRWRASDWPEGHYSVASFEIKPTVKGSKLIFSQSNVPGEQYDAINQGWIDYYWTPMKKMFKGQP